MPSDDSQVQSVIDEFDGHSLDPLRRLSQQHEVTAADASLLLHLIENGPSNTRVAASWILLNSESALSHIDSQYLKRLLNCLSLRDAWQATLHILQLLHKVEVSLDLSQDLYPVLIELSQSSKPFLRAWAISGLLRLRGLNDRQTVRIQTLAQSALVEDAPSVKARIRRALRTTQLS